MTWWPRRSGTGLEPLEQGSSHIPVPGGAGGMSAEAIGSMEATVHRTFTTRSGERPLPRAVDHHGGWRVPSINGRRADLWIGCRHDVADHRWCRIYRVACRAGDGP